MSFRQKAMKILLCLGLQMSVVLGAPVRPDEFEDLLHGAHKARIEFIQREDNRDPDDAGLPVTPEPV